MRIISGSLKGRNILPPKSFKARPTTDFAKEGLFNVLENSLDLNTTTVLDLFAGSGGISLEFASRGSLAVTCVEMNPQHAAFIRETVAALGLTSRIQVIRNNVFDFLKICSRKYSLVFADPPYDLPGLENLPEKIFNAGVLEEDGMVVLEHPATFSFSGSEHFIKEKKNIAYICPPKQSGSGSSAWLEYVPVTHGVAGSSPVRTAPHISSKLLISLLDFF